jgi:hypothetical protein
MGHAILMILFIYGIGILYLIALIVSSIVLAVKNLKNKASKKVATCVIAVLLIGTAHVLFCASHHTDLRYNDWLIVGHNIEFVEKIYGPPSHRESGFASYEIGYYDYCMNLNPDGTVESVCYGVGPGG